MTHIFNSDARVVVEKKEKKYPKRERKSNVAMIGKLCQYATYV